MLPPRKPVKPNRCEFNLIECEEQKEIIYYNI